MQRGWESYLREVISPAAGPNQISETRRAFYAGAAAVFGLIVALSDDAVPMESGFAVMDQIDAELEAFLAEVTSQIEPKGPPQ